MADTRGSNPNGPYDIKAEVKGMVCDFNSNKVPGVCIKYRFSGNSDWKRSKCIETDQNGEYSFSIDITRYSRSPRYVTCEVKAEVPENYQNVTVNPASVQKRLINGDVAEINFKLVQPENSKNSSPTQEALLSSEIEPAKLIHGFRFDGKQIIPTILYEKAEILPPPNTNPSYMMFEDQAVTYSNGNKENDNPFFVQINEKIIPVWKKSPGRFRLLPLHQEEKFDFGNEYFYQDNPRVYLVLSAYVTDYSEILSQKILTAIVAGDVSGLYSWFESFDRTYYIKAFYHPHVDMFMNILNADGVEGLLKRETQELSVQVKFIQRYDPNLTEFHFAFPREGAQFDADEAYSLYNWELFFHAPFMIATHLSKNQRFSEAQRWFHTIFNPTDNSNDPNEPARFWRTLPFYKIGRVKPVDELMKILADKNNTTEEKRELVLQVDQWAKNPFKPDVVARLRPSAYMKTVVMKYLDNLIAWGDQLFRRDTIESINEATQIYVLADQILGRRPERLPSNKRPKVQTYKSLEPELDAFSNSMVQAENILPSSMPNHQSRNPGRSALPLLPTLYFCIPHNEKMLEYWDRVADRLYKIRHCLNIEGVQRQLPLFEPEIDPALFARAAAAGIDIPSVLNDLNSPRPQYRYNIMMQKANELCAEVRSLGAGLLSAMEKRDAEALALVRSKNELDLLQAVQEMKAQAVEEARSSVVSLLASLDITLTRLNYYCTLLSSIQTVSMPPAELQSMNDRLVNTATELSQVSDFLTPIVSQIPNQAASAPNFEAVNARAAEIKQHTQQSMESVMKAVEEFKKESLKAARETTSRLSQVPENSEVLNLPISSFEKKQIDSLRYANEKQKKAMNYQLLAQALSLLPDLNFGVQGYASSPVVHFTIGGTQLSKHVGLQANQFEYEASEHSFQANLSSIIGGHHRRSTEWQHQVDLALKEIEQIGQQIQAGCLRFAIAAQDLANQNLQIEQARAVDFSMRTKYTNQELYSWMIGQISAIYFRSYQLAYDIAKRAEQAFRHELGLRESKFIQFGYWDSLREGLMAGERLFQDLKRMEMAYLDQNQREYEITKHISISQIDPAALIQLRQTGECYFSLPEVLFDIDFPGHYMRRIKSMSITIPCVTGPYTGVNCTLTLLKNSVRISTAFANNQYMPDVQNPDDPRFTESFGAVQTIVTSSAQNDSGMFENNLRDERYLPFEGAGCISTWRIELPTNFPQFEYKTISDIILHLRYTAREGGTLLKQKVRSEIVETLNHKINTEDPSGLQRLFSLRHEFPTQWHKLLTTTDDNGNHIQKFPLSKERFPYLFQGQKITILRVDLFGLLKSGVSQAQVKARPELSLPDGNKVQLKDGIPYNQLVHWNSDPAKLLDVDVLAEAADDSWEMKVIKKILDNLDDIFFLCTYLVKSPASE